ncbi:MAG: MCE family protein, partial [Octadecabacter sp.]|nr:MCE family protein [Octadecabacter sp.]
METRANYILIGAFTLAGIFGLVGLFLWFARVELDQRFSYYDVRFTSVSGLSEASDVRFSGLPVGQVVDVRLSPDRDGTILVRLEVDADTPVRSDSIATIESQGVTGVSYVLIGPGTPSAPLVEATDAVPVPEITAGRSVFQSLSEDAPQLIEETLKVVEDLGTILGGDNQERFDRILNNVEGASETFAQTLNDFSEVAGTVTEFADQIGAFTAILDGLSDDIESLLQSADSTITSIGNLTDEARDVLVTGTDSLVVAQSTFNRADAFINEDLT